MLVWLVLVYLVLTILIALYAARRVPEIADHPADIDRAMCWGFGWEMGPFQLWDTLGFERVLKDLQAAGITLPGTGTGIASGTTITWTGTPTTAGTYVITYQITDNNTAPVTVTVTFNISSGGSSSSGGGGGGGGCSTGGDSPYSWMILLGLLSAFVVFTRVRGSKA